MDLQEVYMLTNWEDFERSTFDFVIGCFEAYTRQYLGDPAEKVYQISIWTDPQGPVTTVSFETMAHAKLHLLLKSGITSEQEQREVAAMWQQFDYRTGLTAFKYREFRIKIDPDLDALASLEHYDEHESSNLGWIELSLLRVVDRFCSEQLLAKLHAEDEVWICVNSASDWCDDVIRVNTKTGVITSA